MYKEVSRYNLIVTIQAVIYHSDCIMNRGWRQMAYHALDHKNALAAVIPTLPWMPAQTVPTLIHALIISCSKLTIHIVLGGKN